MRLSVPAEILKLSRQRAALFWGFVFMPMLTIFISCVLVGIGPPPLASGPTVNAVQPLHTAARALAVGGNPIAQLFYAIGAAAIFAVEYRYSGWRHIVPRASRASLLASKFLTFALFAALSLLLVAMGDAFVSIVLPYFRGVTPVFTNLTARSGIMLILSFLISLAELLSLAGLVALVAIATRSAMGAIIAPFLLSLAATMLQSYLSGSGGGAVPLPTFAGDSLRQWVASPASPELTRSALLSVATLLGWTAAGIGAAIAIFARQDLVSE